MVHFITRYGEIKRGTLVRQYSAFEGGMRYIIEVAGVQYRCIKNGNVYEEYVA